MKFPVDRPTSATGSRFLALLATIVLRSAGTSAFVPAPLGPGGPFGSRTLLPTRSLLRTARPSFPLLASSSSSSSSVPVAEAASSDESASSRRTLGSQELLMLPRQYRPSPDFPFPSMTHCSAYSVGRTPSLPALVSAVEEALAAHPLLRARVEGEGEPSKRIDLFQMVREGDPDPPTFVADASVAAGDVLEVVEVDGEVAEEAWKETFRENLDGATYDAANGPLWKMTLFRSKAAPQESRCVILFTFNHVISDQSSANMIMDQILSTVASIEAGDRPSKAVANAMPRSLEENVLGKGNTWPDGDGPSQISPDTLLYVANKAAEGFKSPVILPDDRSTKDANGAAAALTTISGKSAGGTSSAAFGGRETTLQFRELTEEATEALRLRCREEGVTVTAALAAAVACASSDVVAGENPGGAPKGRNFKVLQSLDMRRVSRTPDPLETVSCQAGSMDLMLGPLSDRTGTKMAAGEEQAASFWNLAREAQSQTQKFVDSDGPKHAVRVFDFAMSISDLNNLVHLTAQSEASQGRAYSAGISNAGVFERQRAVRREGDPSGPEGRENLRSTHGPYVLEDVRFATSHARSGCLYQVSCLTVGGKARFTFHPAAPVVSDETNRVFADRYLRLLEVMAGVREASPAAEDPKGEEKSLLPPNALTLVAAAGAAAGVLVHAEGWASFFSSLAAMRQNVPDDADFWAALNFWIFFAVGHPLLQPILWISDVLHGSPGPRIADLVPATFLLGNVAVLTLLAKSKQISSALNVALFGAFLAYVGGGIDGQLGTGDYNLQLDDSYKGQVVKGCPAYEQVRQPSMDDFDLKKYQGLWYEQKFHDWTQFKEVYDTTLDIKLTPDGTGWIDDFGVKGPAPASAKLSWDKSPVANGAHYFLFGRVDPADPPGVLRESGFGVEFPNYIVDVKRNPTTGEYDEAIQFQCLERGGVRVFEGINFMSRRPQMDAAGLEEMHARAEKAGMYPYGADPEQMHTVARRPEGLGNVDNSWQKMWRAIGVDRLLEMLTESIEDGGR